MIEIDTAYITGNAFGARVEVPASSLDFPQNLLEENESVENSGQFILRRADRELFLSIFTDVSGDFLHAVSFLKKDPNLVKKSGTTTHLYVRAARIMQSIADETGLPLMYVLTTSNKKLMRWSVAKKRGRAIFHWETIIRGGEFYAERKFYPNKCDLGDFMRRGF